MTDRRLGAAALALAVAGVAVAGYLTYVHYAGIAPVCNIAHGCVKVQTSPWSELAGVPVALLGLLGYSAILATLFVPGEGARLAAAGLGVSGFGFSAYLTYREVFSIEALCQWCLLSQALMAGLALVTCVRLVRGPDPEAGLAPAMAVH
ncbi:MAG: vitamin K epoxide reductase family protein [Solirubrobacterales bacterium]|nr:vitamin K epoxide reductase family protein [Solirubrobacterales bacterium]